MSKSHTKSISLALLRQKAEKMLNSSSANSDVLLLVPQTLALINELEVYQQELEVQSQNLLKAQTSAQNALEIYNNSPHGYFTLSLTSEIIDLNNAGAILLQQESLQLIGSSFSDFVMDNNKAVLDNFLHTFLQGKKNEKCELTLALSNANEVIVELTGILRKTEGYCLVSVIDISDKKQIESHNEQERELYKDLLNNQPAGIYRIRVFSKEKWAKNAWESSKNPPYKMEIASDRFCEILGISHSQFEANTAIISDLIHPDDKASFVLKNKEANASISFFECECRLIVNDKIIWIHFESMPRKLQNGDVLWTGIIYDIGEKKRSELALIESDERFQLLFDKAPLGYQSLDINGAFIEVNQQWLDILGYARNEVIGKWFGDFMPPFYQQLVKENFPKFKAQGHIHSEFEMFHKNGDILFIAFDGKIGYDVKGDFKQTHCILQDITESKRIKDALLEAEWKFKALFELGPIGVAYHKMIYDETGKPIDYYFIDTNESYTKLTGVNPKGMTVKQAFPGIENDTIDWIGIFGKVAKTGQTIRFEQFLELNERWYDCVGYQYKPDHFVAAFTEITVRKQAEKALRASEDKFKKAFTTSPDAIAITRMKDYLFVSINAGFTRITGYTEDDILGKKVADVSIWADMLESEKLMHELTAKGIVENKISKFRTKSGRLIFGMMSATIIELDGEKHILSITRDITDLKNAEEKLQKSELMLKAVLDNFPGIVFWKDTHSYYLGSNLEFALAAGFKNSDEIIGLSDFDLPWSRTEAANYQADDAEVMQHKKQKLHIIETQFRHDGSIVWLDTSKVPFTNQNDEVIGVIGVSTDITERKKAQDELIESEVQYHNLANSGTALIWASGLDKLCYYFNEPWLKFTGRTLEQELGNGWTESVHPQDFEHCLNTYLTFFDKRQAFEMEYRMRNAEGNYRWILDLGKPNFNSLGEFVGYIGYCFDITERKIIDDALQQSEKKLSTLFGSMTEMVVVHELILNEIGSAIDYRIIDCNDSFTHITGFEKEDAKGKFGSELYHTEKAPYIDEYIKVCITGESVEFKTYFAPLDKHFLISAISMGINQFATITTDITAIEKTHEVIRDKNKELESYIYVASHDLRSPLVNIQGFSQRLEKQTAELKKIVQDTVIESNIKTELDKLTLESIPKSLNYILSNVLKMDKLINSLLQLSRTGRITMDIRKIDMNHFFDTIIAAHNFELTEIEANVHIANLDDCYGDDNQLNQLFSNIITNAIKYSDKGRPFVLEIGSKTHYKRVIYSIKDSGLGINVRHLEKIWEVFYRVDSSSPEAGEGIGLSIARRIVDKHEGKIWVESEEGVGSTFFIELHRYKFGE